MPPAPSLRRPTPRSLAALLLLAAATLLALACGLVAPEPSEVRAWEAASPPRPSTAQAPLAVLVKNPVGQINTSQAIHVIFNQPVASLTDLDTQKAKAAQALQLSPPVDGAFRWIGTSTLSFVPKAPLTPATRYTVTVPAGVTALSGDALSEPLSWDFETARPEVADSAPYNGERGLAPDVRLSLTFSQPMTLDSLTDRVRLLGPDDAPIPTSLRFADPARTDEAKALTDAKLSPTQRLIITPSAPLPLDQTFTLQVDAGAQSQLGPLPSTTPFSASFSTYGPLTVEEIGCGYDDCAPASPIYVHFSNPLSAAALSDPPTPEQVAALLTISPPADLLSTYTTWERDSVSLYYKLQPDTAYTLTIKQGVTDAYGQPLPADEKRTIAVGSFRPTVKIATGQGVMEPSLIAALPGVAMNYDTIQARTLRLHEDDILPALDHIWHDAARDAMFKEALPNQKPWAAAIKLTGKRNIWRAFSLPFTHSLGASAKGVLFYDLYPLPLSPNPYGTPHRAYRYGIIQSTDLGLTTKLSPDETLTWVTGLSDAKPISGVTVKLRDQDNAVIWTGTTDASGLARGPGLRDIKRPENYTPLLITAQRGDELSFLNIADADTDLRPWNFNIPYQWDWKDFRYAVHAFTDRGVYRAGDTVHFKATIREDARSQWAVPTTRRFSVKVFNSRDQEILTRDDVALSPFGSFTLDVPLAADAPMGGYSIAIHDQPFSNRWDVTHTAYFRVESYRTPEFKVRVDAPASAIAGQPITASAQGDYLFGAPMSGAAVSWTALRYPANFHPSGDAFDGFSFTERHTEGGGDYGSLSDQQQASLDASGAHTYALTVPAGSLTQPTRYVLNADVRDLNRQSISSSASVLVHPGDRYLGVGFDGFMAPTDKPVTLRYVAVSTAGDPIGGVDASLKVFLRQWSITRERSDESDWYYRSTYEDKQVGACALTSSAAGPVDCQVDLRASGAGYYFARAEGKDSQGVALTSSLGFYAYGDGMASWDYHNDSTIQLVADRATYAPGDQARLLIKSPWPQATALITTERSGVLTTEVRHLTSNAQTFTLPITEEHIPNVFVSVALVQGRTAAFDPKAADDPGRPAMRLGYLSLPVAVSQRRLSVDVSASAAEVLPGSEAQVSVRVRDAAGKGAKAEVALYAVDEGVLSLTGYQTPDPMTTFYAPRPLGVSMSDSRLHFFKLTSEALKGDDSAGDGVGADDGGTFRSVFSTTPLWLGQLVTADDGTASVTVKMPDNLTTFRVMAVAASAEARFGSGQGQVRVSKPLLVRSALPRFARLDDVFEASAVINNRSDAPVTATVQLDLDPATLQALEPQARQVIVDPGKGKEVRFKVRALSEGRAKVRFSITPAGAPSPADAVEVRLPILSSAVTEVVGTSGVADAPILERVQAPARIHPAIGGLDVTLATTALVDLSESLRYVIDYPYDCAEQMASKLMTLAAMRPLLSRFNLLDLSEATLDDAARRLTTRLARLQHWSGGFAMWPDSGDVLDHGTIYILHALSLARAQGIPTDDDIINSGLSYLRRIATTPAPFRGGSQAAWNSTRAYALYTLATLQQPDLSTLSALFDARDQLSLLGRSYLLLALVASDAPATQVADLTQALENAAAIDTHGAYFGDPQHADLGVIWSSDVRATAITMLALTAANPNHPLLPKVASWLQAQRSKGRWHNTQDNAFAAAALLSYFDRLEATEPDLIARLFIGKRLRFEQPFRGRSQAVITHRVPMPELTAAASQDLTLDPHGQGRLYYAMRLTYAPTDMPLPPREEGFTILRRYEDLTTGKPLTSFKAGDVVKVRLTIVAPHDRQEVAVRDPLPAGLEPISLDFQTASAALRHQLAASEQSTDPDDGWYWRPNFDHIEKRDDAIQMFASYLPAGVYEHTYLARATTFGTFTAPAALVEEMYDPDVFGRSDASLTDVK